MLAFEKPHELEWPGGKLPLRGSRDDELLIGCASTDHLEVLGGIFTGKHLLPIHLDPADLLPGSPAAWETLDAIALDAKIFSRITDAQRSVLLAGGVQLIAIGNSAPDTRWPWHEAGPVWVLACPIAGPVNELVNENIYTPTYGWTPGWSASVRAQVIGAAILLVLVILSLMLWPSRATPWISIGVCIASSIAIIAWRGSLGSVDRAGGDILLKHPDLTQRDSFVYERAKEDSSQAVPWTGSTHPLFASQDALQNAHMQLHISSTGELQFNYSAEKGHTLAFLHRDLQPGSIHEPVEEIPSPMRDAAQAEYLQPGDRIIGSIPQPNGRWPTVVIERK